MGVPIISEFFETTVGKVVDKVLDFIPDPTMKAQAAKEIRDMALNVATQQNEINKTYASSGNTFLAGGRQFMIWVGACGFGYTFIGQPLIVTLILLWNPAFPVEKLPAIDWSKMSGVILGLLGLGG